MFMPSTKQHITFDTIQLKTISVWNNYYDLIKPGYGSSLKGYVHAANMMAPTTRAEIQVTGATNISRDGDDGCVALTQNCSITTSSSGTLTANVSEAVINTRFYNMSIGSYVTFDLDNNVIENKDGGLIIADKGILIIGGESDNPAVSVTGSVTLQIGANLTANASVTVQEIVLLNVT
jgi:hypothetical protein